MTRAGQNTGGSGRGGGVAVTRDWRKVNTHTQSLVTRQTPRLQAERISSHPLMHLSVKIGSLRCVELVLGAQPTHANLHNPTNPSPLCTHERARY